MSVYVYGCTDPVYFNEEALLSLKVKIDHRPLSLIDARYNGINNVDIIFHTDQPGSNWGSIRMARPTDYEVTLENLAANLVLECVHNDPHRTFRLTQLSRAIVLELSNSFEDVPRFVFIGTEKSVERGPVVHSTVSITRFSLFRNEVATHSTRVVTELAGHGLNVEISDLNLSAPYRYTSLFDLGKQPSAFREYVLLSDKTALEKYLTAKNFANRMTSPGIDKLLWKSIGNFEYAISEDKKVALTFQKNPVVLCMKEIYSELTKHNLHDAVNELTHLLNNVAYSGVSNYNHQLLNTMVKFWEEFSVK